MNVAPVRLEGDTIYIRPLDASDAQALLDLRCRDREFLAPFEPARSERFYTFEAQAGFIQMALGDWASDDAYAFGIFDPSTDAMIGRVALSNVVRGAWQNATLGYFVSEGANGRGVATEAVRLVVTFAFRHAELHRVQAGVMVHNGASARVLLKNGFRYEGRSPRYIKINGVWEDHDLYAVTAEDFEVLA